MIDAGALVKRMHEEAFTYVDGQLHIDIPKILEIVGWPDTPATRQAVAVMAAEACRQIYPGVEVMQLDVRNN